MQKILWLGQPYFAEELKLCGWDQLHIEPINEYKLFTWQELVAKAGFIPDVLIAADQSLPPAILGMENFPCFTIFYTVDDHIHSWHRLYAQGFDAVLVSLKDFLPQYEGPGLSKDRIWWSPPFAREADRPIPSIEKEWDCLFVGNIDQELMPKRAKFMKQLASALPTLQIRKGNYQQLFPKSKILINHADAGDLNFRVFEALGCGGCLVTPRIKNGLTDLFIDGEHLVEYTPEDVGDAVYRIEFLLNHPDVADHIRKMGHEEVNSHHRARHRAEALTDHLCDIAMQDVQNIIRSRSAQAESIRQNSLAITYLHWANELESPEQKQAFLAAAQGRYGLNGINP